MRLDSTGEITEPPHGPYLFPRWMSLETLAEIGCHPTITHFSLLRLSGASFAHQSQRRTDEKSAKRTSHVLPSGSVLTATGIREDR